MKRDVAIGFQIVVYLPYTDEGELERVSNEEIWIVHPLGAICDQRLA